MSNIDDKIKKLFDIISDKKNKIAKLEKPTYLTNMSYPINEFTSERVNLHTVKDECTLVKFLVNLNLLKREFDSVCEKMNLSTELKYGGFTVDAWINDLTIQINRLNIKKEQDDLANKEAKLNELISPEERRRLDVEALEKELL